MVDHPTHLDIITRAYAACGVTHVVRQSDSGQQFLFLCGDHERENYETADVDLLCRLHKFMEFTPAGEVASY